jgi:hypothetical protein
MVGHNWTIVQNKTPLLTLKIDHAKKASTLARFIIYSIILCHFTRHIMGKKLCIDLNKYLTVVAKIIFFHISGLILQQRGHIW